MKTEVQPEQNVHVGASTVCLRRKALKGNELHQAIFQVMGSYLNPSEYRIFIFGSEADGTAPRGADIDIGILGPQRVNFATLQLIREKLEGLATLRPFDMVDFSMSRDSFRTQALRKTIPYHV